MDNSEVLGSNLKRLRTERQLSLGQLAALSGVSKVMLSQMEKGEANPTINTIWKIAAGLCVHYTELLDSQVDDTIIVKKSKAVVQIENGGDYKSYSYYNASPDRTFDLFVIELLPGRRYSSEGHLAGSKEYLLINKGSAKIIIGSSEYVLEEGDSFCLDGDKQHTYVNIGSDVLNCTTLINYR